MQWCRPGDIVVFKATCCYSLKWYPGFHPVAEVMLTFSSSFNLISLERREKGRERGLWHAIACNKGSPAVNQTVDIAVMCVPPPSGHQTPEERDEDLLCKLLCWSPLLGRTSGFKLRQLLLSSERSQVKKWSCVSKWPLTCHSDSPTHALYVALDNGAKWIAGTQWKSAVKLNETIFS